MVGNALDFLIEGALLQLHKYNGNPIGLQLPMFVELNVVEAEPAARGDFSSGSGTKLAKLETGLEIRVPPFIKEGEKVKVTTGDGGVFGSGLEAVYEEGVGGLTPLVSCSQGRVEC